MRTPKLTLLVILLTLVVAVAAQAAKPKNGTFKGSVSKTCAGDPCTAKLSLKVKHGKVTKLNYKIGLYKVTVVPKKPIKVSKKGKFKYRHVLSKFSKTTDTLRGRFTSRSKVKGTYERSSLDSTQIVSKTKFTLKRK